MSLGLLCILRRCAGINHISLTVCARYMDTCCLTGDRGGLPGDSVDTFPGLVRVPVNFSSSKDWARIMLDQLITA
mgnify:CR=1 FL=1